jgi:glycosyltransferase involved in cell wall biosynthesis
MVGPLAKVEYESLPQAPNLHWMGQRAYSDLPAIVKAFDVCLMPFALNDSTRYINPTKTLEYMAAGKPIVSTAVPDVVHHFTPVVQVASSEKQFVDLVAKALQEPNAARLRQGIERARAASWDVIVEKMRKDMCKAVGIHDCVDHSALSATGGGHALALSNLIAEAQPVGAFRAARLDGTGEGKVRGPQ